MKKVFAMLLALMIVMSLAMPTMATTVETYSITINNAENDHTYDAYQIFDGDLYNGVLSNITWGAGVADGDALLAALKADTFQFTMNYVGEGNVTQTKTTTLSAELASVEDAADVATFLTKLSDDSFGLDRFAEIVGAYDSAAKAHKYLGTPTQTVENQNGGKYTFTGLDAGYYMIKDRDGTQDGEYDFYTKYILRVTKNQTVNVKGNPVKLDKLIGTDLNGDYTDWKDFDITDIAYYKLIATTPDNYDNYQRFMYKFTDTLPEGITFNRVEKIIVRNKTNHTDILATLFDATTDTVTDDVLKNVDGVNITQDISANLREVVITLENMKVLIPNMTSNYELVVDYSANVNKEVLISEYGSVDPNTNKVYLEYTNNPNGEGVGKTVEDIAHAFTFTIKLNKLIKDAEKDDTNAKLAGAEFIIYYKHPKADGSTTNMYATTVVEEGKTVLDGYTETRDEAYVFKTDASGNVALYGVDSGDYWLEEIKAPAGYNLLDAPVKVSITPNIVLNADGTVNETSSTVNITVDGHEATDGIAYIENSAGSTLPETGGIGTTMFYIIGSIMVLGAAVILITKKRMSAEA